MLNAECRNSKVSAFSIRHSALTRLLTALERSALQLHCRPGLQTRRSQSGANMKIADTAAAGLDGQTIVDLTRKHTLFEWSAQNAVDPIPVAGAKGCWFWTPEGKRFLDFNSQLMCVNIGHGDERVVRAIQRQAETLAYANPFMATEPRALLGRKLAQIAPGDIDTFFFTNGGAEANENAIKLARQAT